MTEFSNYTWSPSTIVKQGGAYYLLPHPSLQNLEIIDLQSLLTPDLTQPGMLQVRQHCVGVWYEVTLALFIYGIHFAWCSVGYDVSCCVLYTSWKCVRSLPWCSLETIRFRGMVWFHYNIAFVLDDLLWYLHHRIYLYKTSYDHIHNVMVHDVCIRSYDVVSGPDLPLWGVGQN